VTTLVLTRLDYGNANIASIPPYLLKRLQSVMNSAARLVFSSSRYDHIIPLLCQLHWLKARERTDFKLAIHVSIRSSSPSYLADELSQPSDFEARRRLRSASSSSLIVRRTRLSTIGELVTEPFRLPQLAFRTVCRSMSRLHHHCLFSAAI